MIQVYPPIKYLNKYKLTWAYFRNCNPHIWSPNLSYKNWISLFFINRRSKTLNENPLTERPSCGLTGHEEKLVDKRMDYKEMMSRLQNYKNQTFYAVSTVGIFVVFLFDLINFLIICASYLWYNILCMTNPTHN